jgi:hypothetical protein
VQGFADVDNVNNDPNQKMAVCTNEDPLSQELKGALNCDKVMSDYCTGDKAFNDPNCSGYFAANAGPLNANKFAYCSQGSNFQLQECLTFCNSDGASGDTNKSPYKDQCDSMYTQKCQKDNSPVCSCLSKPNISDWAQDPNYATVSAAVKNTPGASVYPQCYFQTCNKSGYKTFANNSSKVGCPTCLNLLSVTNANGIQSVGGAVQACNLSTGSAPAPASAAPAKSSSSSPPSPSSTQSASNPSLVQKITGNPKLMLLVVAVVLILVMLMFLGGDNDPSSATTKVLKFVDIDMFT